MKKILVLSVIIAAFFSCSTDDSEDTNFSFEVLPIESATLPDEVEFGKTYIIDYSYFLPSSCHTFSDLYYIADGNTRIVAVVNSVLDRDEEDCVPFTNELIEKSFNFLVREEIGSYTFKFWQGEDETGEDIFLVYNVPIVN